MRVFHASCVLLLLSVDFLLLACRSGPTAPAANPKVPSASSMARLASWSCPTKKGESSLSSVAVFDGPPEAQAALIPDVSQDEGDHAYASWHVRYVYEAGRRLFLLCRYARFSDVVTVEVRGEAQRCVYQRRLGHADEMVCE